MKKTVLLVLLIFFVSLFPARAALGSKGLILEGGKQQITLYKGEKEYLNVRDGWTDLPVFKGITFYSDNTMVATVGQHSGIIRANGYGTATVYAVNKKGDAGRIQVCVKQKGKVRFLPIIFIALSILSFLFWRRAQKNSIC